MYSANDNNDNKLKYNVGRIYRNLRRPNRRAKNSTFLVKWDGVFCPCCGYRLRTKPHNLKLKAKLTARKNTAEYLLQYAQPKNAN